MNEIFNNFSFFENSLKDIIIAVSVMLGGIIVVFIFNKVILRAVSRKAAKTDTQWDDLLVRVLDKYASLVFYYTSIYIGFEFLKVDSHFKLFLGKGFVILIVYAIIRAFSDMIDVIFTDKGTPQLLQNKISRFNGIKSLFKILIWIVALIFLLDNLGFQINTIITGLGIGGIAVALAAQAILSDLFSFVAINLDRPFDVGDFIAIDNFMGTVEHIGIKTTRVRSIQGEELIISNKDLTSSVLRNYKKITKRRVVHKLGVDYNTDPAVLKIIPDEIKKIVSLCDNVQFDRAHFTSFGVYSLEFELVYFILSDDYYLFMDRQQSINLEILDTFSKKGIKFAYPTQVLYINNSCSGGVSEVDK